MKSIFFVLMLISFNLSGQTLQDKIIGSWCFCTHDGNYVELHIEKDFVRSAFGGDSLIGNGHYFYIVDHDSMRFSIAPLHLKTENAKYAKKILIVSEEIIILQSKQESDTLYRLDMKFEPQPKSEFPSAEGLEIAKKWYARFEENFNKRIMKRICVDKRPIEEQMSDTINVDCGTVKDDYEEVIYPIDSTDN